MEQHPTLESERLILRPFTLADAPEVHRLVSERAVAETTLNIPHPYEVGMAEAWIDGYQERFESGEVLTFAITSRMGDILLGTISLRITQMHSHAEIGYWVGLPYWGQGYCTEATQAILQYGFETLGLHRIYASHFKSNPASGRVMQKAGMTYEGCLREHIYKWGKFEDSVQYSMLKREFLGKASG